MNQTSSTVIANVSSDSYASSSLLDMVANTPHSTGDPGCNSGSSTWSNGFKTFTVTSSSGSFFTQNYIKIWHGDTSNDCADRVVFSAGSNSHGEWSGIGNIGAVGAEFRMSGNSSDSKYYGVWIR